MMSQQSPVRFIGESKAPQSAGCEATVIEAFKDLEPRK